MVSQMELVKMNGIRRDLLSWATHFISAVILLDPKAAQKTPVGLTMTLDIAGPNGSFRSHQIS